MSPIGGRAVFTIISIFETGKLSGKEKVICSILAQTRGEINNGVQFCFCSFLILESSLLMAAVFPVLFTRIVFMFGAR